MTRRFLLVVLALAVGACDSQEPELEPDPLERGRFEARVQGDLTRSLEGDASVMRFPGSAGNEPVFISLSNQVGVGGTPRSVAISGTIAEPGVYDLGAGRIDGATVTYFDGLNSLNDGWVGRSGSLRIESFDSDGIVGSLEAILAQVDPTTGETRGEISLEANFDAVTFEAESL